MESSLMDSLTAIANVVGLPACLLVGWLFMRVKQLGKEVENLKADREADRRDADSKWAEVYNKLNAVLSDVSYIRGKLEG